MSDSDILYKKLLNEAINDKNKLTSTSVKNISRLYEDIAEDLIRKASTSRGGFTIAWTKDYEKYIKNKIMELNNNLVKLETEAIKTGAEIAASVNGDFVSYVKDKYELDIDKELINFAYSISDDVLLKVLDGKIYKDNRGLSERIWRHTRSMEKDIQYVITHGLGAQKSYLEIIKDLENYLKPGEKKDWEFSKVYPGVKNKTVDYNAQRLLRTSVNHIFHVASIQKAMENPYVEAMHWNLSSQHYERQVKHFGEDECDDYANQNDYELGTGNFPKNKVPIPHPQCLCYTTCVITKSLDDIGRELGQWIRGKDIDYLNKWLKVG
ncbi:MAG: hypothetical protein E7J31_09710 [Clostridium sp.]|uniref:hypothetical protein n=1 Tax=Clostridium sp. TaxID=1506 RepID=UPI0029093ACF|nr:hypothetical protein [Clostridium sp.]MDU7948704.1 hypothetical protein [Clostridium sp.]